MTARHLYRLYGLLAASDLPMPELSAVESGQPEIFFRYAHVPQDGLEDGKQLGPFHAVTPGKLWLHVPNIARFLVLDGKEIWIDPSPGIDEDSLRIFLLGSCLGALLMQRGLLVLRGCAVRIGDGCLLCLSDSGAGKSTLAAALMRRGYAILSDDVVAIDSENRAIPGFPDIKLWHDAAVKLGISTERLRRTRPGIEKFHVPLNDSFQSNPLPIRQIYTLRPHTDPAFLIENLHGMDRFSALHENSYRPGYMAEAEYKAKHWQRCINLAKEVQMKSLHRPRFPLLLNELTDLILKDMGGAE